MSHYHLWTESTDQLSTDTILNTIIFHSSRLLQYVGAFMSLCGCACSITIEWMRPNPNNTFFYKCLNSWRLVIEAFDAQVMLVLTFWLLLELKYKYMMCQYWTYELIHLWTCDQDHAADPLRSPQRWVGAELLLANSRSGLWLRAPCTSASPHLTEHRDWLQRGRPLWWDHLGQKLNCQCHWKKVQL